jgi:hypothetical protein
MLRNDPTPRVSATRAAPESSLQRTATAVFERLGAAVRVDPEGDNLVRRVARGREASTEFEVEAQGLPNLLHELVHAQFLGRLDDDHGFDYGAIPLDLDRPEHRRWLWEELACCALSCAGLWPRTEHREDAWFAEQFEIQGIFYGCEDIRELRVRIDSAVSTHRAELEQVLSDAKASFLGALPDADPPGFWVLWERYRRAVKKSRTS